MTEYFIFDFTYVDPAPTEKKLNGVHQHIRIAALTLKEAVDKAIEMGVPMEWMSNVQNTRQVIHSLVIPVAPLESAS